MATTRFGHLDDFTLKNSKVGIGTSTPTEALEVLGGARSKDIVVTGIATLTSYEGFQNKKTSYVDNVNITGGESGTLSGEIVIGAGLTMSVGTGATTGQGSIDSLKVSNTFTPPIGGTNDRPSAPKPGAIFYNKDFRTIEYWDGNFWRQVDNTTASGRVVCWGGQQSPFSPTVGKVISYVNIASKGNAVRFGTSADTAGHTAGMSNAIRGVFAGRTTPSESIEYITLASEGNSIDFGDLTGSRDRASGLSSSTRGLIAGGQTPTHINTIEYVEMMTLGNSIDFGDLTTATNSPSSVSNGTRGVFAYEGNISQVTISSKGNSVWIGRDLFNGQYQSGGASSGTRGIWASGQEPGGATTTSIRGVDISSAGNAVEFGNLSLNRSHASGSGSHTRGIWMGGWISPNENNTIDYVNIQSGGEAEDFGDLLSVVYNPGVVSDCHGGLGGY